MKSILGRGGQEAEAQYRCSDGDSIRLTVRKFESHPRVGGHASFSVLLRNDGTRVWVPSRLVLRWKRKESSGEDVVLEDQTTLDLPPLEPGGAKAIKGLVLVPVNGAWDVNIEFHIVTVDGRNWQSSALPATLRRRVSGQSAEDVPADFDYEVMYRTADLQKDWWTPVGPATRAEYEMLGRGKSAQLVALGLEPHSRVLDIGCGTGQLTEALVPILSSEGLYYGTDLAEPAVAFCRARFSQYPQFHFVKNEQTRIPIHGIEFDYIYLGSVFTHMFPADIEAMLAEIRRLLASSGCVVADAFVSPSIADFVGNRAMIQLNEGNLLAAFRRHDFEVQELFGTNWNEQCRRVIYKLTVPGASSCVT